MRTTLALISLTLVFGIARAQDEGDPDKAEVEKVRSKPSAAKGLDPGTTLGPDNAHLARDLLPPEVLRHYESGGYRNEIAAWPENAGKNERFEARSAENGKHLDVDENGTIIDTRTGKQPDYVWGTPFPDIDPSDPKAGVKVVWNYFYNYWWNGNSRNIINLVWLNPERAERQAIQDVYFKYYDGLPPELAPEKNPDNLLVQFITTTLSPSDLYGTAALGWRYRDADKRDKAWAYVPALRRIRELSPANRSDGFLGSDMSQDDGPFFDGKPEDFTWKLAGETEMLRIVDPFRLTGDVETVELPGGGYRGLFPDVPNMGFQDPGWDGLAWAPIAFKLVKRKMWVVEAVPDDRYYLYGKIQLTIDQETWEGAYNRKFDWKGELLNTLSIAGGPAQPSPDGKYYFSSGIGGGAVAQIAENIKMNRATVATVDPKPNLPNDRHIPLDPALFDYQSLYRFGK